jgi:hypothetical protein
MGIARKCPDAAPRLGNVAKGQEEYAGVVVFEASVEIMSRLVRIPK